MRRFMIVLLAATGQAHAAPRSIKDVGVEKYKINEVQVDDSRAKAGIIGITIQGGKGSEAQKLYDSLTIPEVDDHAMGGRAGKAKQGKGISCSVENDAHVKDAYSCVLKVGREGEALAPEK